METSLRERLATLSRGELIGLLLVVGATLSGAVLWYIRSLPEPISIAASTTHGAGASGSGDGFSATTGQPGASTAPSASPAPGVIVDVAGWVQHPGVFEFPADARAIDALERAGGPRKGADLEALNLAAPLLDGQQLLIPGPPQRRTPEEPSVNGTSTSDLININTADAGELEELPGVGEVIAAKIVEYRDDNGPFSSPDDLMDVSGIGEVTFAEMESEVTV